MKKRFILAIFVYTAIIFSSCKKKDSDPTPVASTPAINQPSTTAPSLVAGSSTALTLYTGSGNDELLDLTPLVTDPQGDDWTVTSATSSNTSVATVEVRSEGGEYAIAYSGLSTGTATLTIVVADDNGNSNTLTFTMTVSQSPNAPTLNAGANTNLTVQAGSDAYWDISDIITDPQNDDWDVIAVTSSNTAVATVTIDDYQYIEYTGIATGTATMTFTVEDADQNTSTYTATIQVTAAPIVIIAVPQNGAPTLNPGVNTSLTIQEGSNASWNLSDKVTDAEGNTWTVTNVTSSNTTIASVTIDGAQSINYLGANAGTATITVTVSDGTLSNTITASINVAPKIVIGGGDGGIPK